MNDVKNFTELASPPPQNTTLLHPEIIHTSNSWYVPMLASDALFPTQFAGWWTPLTVVWLKTVSFVCIFFSVNALRIPLRDLLFAVLLAGVCEV